MAESLRLAGAALQPIMPGTSEKINSVLGFTPSVKWSEQLVWGTKLEGSKVDESLVLFPRPQPAAPKQ
jgi:methionyl-tRNA synthetase